MRWVVIQAGSVSRSIRRNSTAGTVICVTPPPPPPPPPPPLLLRLRLRLVFAVVLFSARLMSFSDRLPPGSAAAAAAGEEGGDEPRGPVCEECGAPLEGLTGIQILRHRRSHRAAAPAGDV